MRGRIHSLDHLTGGRAHLLRGLSLGLLFASLLPLEAGAPALQPDGLRVLLADPPPGGDGEADRALRRALETLGAHCVPLSSGRLDGAEAIILDRRAAALPSLWNDGALAALERMVRDGAGLIILGRAAAASPGSEVLTRLIGRKPPIPRGEPPGGVLAPGGLSREVPAREILALEVLALEITEQSHPITQCVTHLALDRATAFAEADGTGIVLARALEAPPGAAAGARGEPPPEGRPVLWARNEGRGRVAVFALEADEGDTGKEGASSARRREEDALAFLAARMVEWAAGRTITIRIPESVPIAASRLGAADSGTLPGLPARKGFYRGRQIAPVMGYQALGWLFRSEREETEMPEKVLDALEIEEGSTVADVGAGGGYFTFRLARRVGPAGKVIATDIQEEMLKALGDRIAAEGVKNVEAVLASERDPRLPEGKVDLVLLVDVYHELSSPDAVASAIARSLRAPREGKRGGRLVLVEYRGEDPSVPIKPLHRMTELQARAELEPLGFRWVATKGFLPHQHVIIFER